MRGKLKNMIKAITPPIILRGAKAVLYVLKEEEGEKGPKWYDAAFERSDHYRRHYSQSPYYFLWTVIADRIVRAKVEPILEIGCGPGQLACLLRDKGISKYHTLVQGASNRQSKSVPSLPLVCKMLFKQICSRHMTMALLYPLNS